MVFIISNFLMMATWPYLGANYFKHLGEAFAVSGNFFWDNNVLFFGRQILSTQLPWTYLPLWILVTAPLIILFFLGASFWFVRRKKENLLFVLLALALCLNLALDFIFKPVLYDGLRHFLFLLPIMAVLAAMSALEFWVSFDRILIKKTIIAFSVLGIFAVASHLARLHPYEYVYFNELIGGLKGSEGRLDNDYWGASYREAVEWLKKNEIKDSKRVYRIAGSGNSYQIFYFFSENMKWVDGLKGADYYLSTTRDDRQKAVDPSKVIHVVDREGVPLCYVFKLK
jgi:hypothetical protein